MSYYIILCGKSQAYVNEKLLYLNIILILRAIYLSINKHFATSPQENTHPYPKEDVITAIIIKSRTDFTASVEKSPLIPS